MPNHVTNRISLVGIEEEVLKVIKEVSTFYPETPGVTYTGDVRYVNEKGSEHHYGFLDEKTGVFSRRGEEDVDGVLEGYVVDMEPSWTRFPDFDKIIPMPDSLNITADSFVSAMDSNTYHRHDLFLESLTKVREYADKSDDKEKGEETIKNFLTGVENYLRYGYATWYGWAPKNWGTKWNGYSCEKESEYVFKFQTAWNSAIIIVEAMSKKYPEVDFEFEWADEDTGNNCGSVVVSEGVSEGEEIENESRGAYKLAFKLNGGEEDYELVGGSYQYKEEEEEE